jgi:hypothetical protein
MAATAKTATMMADFFKISVDLLVDTNEKRLQETNCCSISLQIYLLSFSYANRAERFANSFQHSLRRIVGN